jgi:IS30 family transposase
MALERDEHGRFRRPAEYDSAAFRADLLLRQRTSEASVRELAAESGRSKSSIASDLKRARHEERVRLDAERALTQPVQPEPKRKPRPRALVLPRSRYREGLAAVLESNEHVHLERAANVRAGLSASGMARYKTSNGRGSYAPLTRTTSRESARSSETTTATRRPIPGCRTRGCRDPSRVARRAIERGRDPNPVEWRFVPANHS